MIKKEKTLYKDGRKNHNGYKNNPFDIFEKKWIPIALSVLIPMALVVSVVEAFNVTSWNKIFSSVGIIDGTQVADENFVVYCLDVGQSDCTVTVLDLSFFLVGIVAFVVGIGIITVSPITTVFLIGCSLFVNGFGIVAIILTIQIIKLAIKAITWIVSKIVKGGKKHEKEY